MLFEWNSGDNTNFHIYKILYIFSYEKDIIYTRTSSVIYLTIINYFERRAMLQYHKCLAILICFSIFVSARCSYAEEEIEDLIDIFVSNSKIIAIIEGKNTITSNLRSKEKVLWRGSSGYLGAFLTNHRFLVISTSSNAWQALPLRKDESEKRVVSLSPYIALLVTGDRAIGFDAESNQFIETRLPIHDELIKAKAEKYVAVVITSSLVFGLAAETSAFAEVRLRVRETIEAVKVTSRKVIVRTSDRLLAFDASGSTWNEHRL